MSGGIGGRGGDGVDVSRMSQKTIQPLHAIIIPQTLGDDYQRYAAAVRGDDHMKSALSNAQRRGLARVLLIYFFTIGVASLLTLLFPALLKITMIILAVPLIVGAIPVSQYALNNVRKAEAGHPPRGTSLSEAESVSTIPRTSEEQELVRNERLRDTAHLVAAIAKWNNASFDWHDFVRLVSTGRAIMRPSNELAYEELLAERSKLVRRLTRLLEPGSRNGHVFRVVGAPPDIERAAIAEEQAEIEATAAVIPTRMDVFHRYFS